MPKLTWIGKEKVVNHHLEVPYRVLQHRYGFNADNAGDTSFTGSGNMIIHGDNLEALKALLPEYEGKVKCIYIDPPYNTGNEGWVYNDNVNDPHIQKWLQDTFHDSGVTLDDLTRHDKWLCMMYPRLSLLQKLLREDGIIFISIDDNEQANLKLICDEIFGAKNFVAQMIWRGGKRNLAKWISTSHEYMLLYAKDLNTCSQLGITWKEKKNGIDEIYKAVEDSLKTAKGDYKLATSLLKQWFKQLPNSHPSKDHSHYCNIDAVGVYCMDNVSRVGGGKYSVISPKTGNVIAPPSRGWTYGNEEDFWKAYSMGIIEFTDNDRLPIFKRYLKDNETQLLETVFYKDRRSSSQKLKELMGSEVFQFPKDEGIIRHFIETFTDDDAIILDSFAGSGTTAHAVLNLNKKNGGNRKFILVEMEDYADNITAERVRRVMNGYADTEGTGGAFDFYELGETMFNADGSLNDAVGEDRIREYVYYTDTKQHLSRKREAKNPYLLDTWNGVGYYLYYEQGKETTLNYDKLSIIKEKAERYIVYADTCTLDKDYMTEHNITFRKIPRDIQKF